MIENSEKVHVTKAMNITAYKESVFGVILIRIFPAFYRIWTEYGETRRYVVSLRIQSECGKMPAKCGPE